jgi:phosphatidate cytidylyltransferase
MKIFTEHQERWLTGIGLLIVVATIGIIDSYIVMWTFLGAIYILAFHEAMLLFKLNVLGAYIWAMLLWVFAYFYPNPDDLFFVMALIFAGSLAYLHNFDKRLLLPFLYPASGFFFFLALYKDYHIFTLFWLLSTVAIVDIGAFLVGKVIGKHPFSDTSPNKTWEGVIGGLVLATIVGSIVGSTIVPLEIAIVVTFVTALAAIFGDLFESYLKREAGVKDSGNILPGHGGMLDRVDGFIFGAPTMLILLRSLL